jgi:hypothetical protein
MKPGRELDALVAVKVMGAQSMDHKRPLDHGAFLDPVPHYSTDIAAAAEILEKVPMTLVAPRAQISPGRFNGVEWMAVAPSKPYDDQVGNFVFAETAPHAICLAALKALGATPDR